MKKKVSQSAHEVKDEVYQSGLSGFKIFLIGISFLVIGFLANFPVREKLDEFLSSTLKNNPDCPITFQSLKIGALLHKIDLMNPEVMGRCYNNPYTSLPLDHLSLSISRPSLVPPGLSIDIKVAHKNTNLTLSPTLSFSEHIIKIQNSILDLQTLAPLLGENIELIGKMDIDALFYINGQSINNGKFSIKSTNLNIPNQNIKGFNISTLNVGDFLIQGKVKGQNILEIKKFIFGNAESPLISELSGTITLAPTYMPSSEIDIKGKLKISHDFQRSMPILNLFLGGKKTDEKGFFNIAISGTFASPKPKIQ